MKQVPLTEVPEVLGPAFEAGDPASAAKERERTNVERLAQIFGVIAAGRFEELRAFMAPDVTFELVGPVRLDWVRRADGADEVVAAIATNFGKVCEQRPEPLALVAQGDEVMVMAREAGRLTETGERYEILLAQRYSFRDGGLAAFQAVAAEAGEPAAPVRA